MKLACVIHRFGPQITGGSEAHCRAIATHLAAAGHDVEILTSCATDYVTWANALPAGESRDGDLRVRRFSVIRPRHLNRFREISEIVFTGRATESEQEAWFRLNGPELPTLLDHLRAHGHDYDRVLFWSYRYYHSFFGVPIVKDRAILVPTAEDDEIIRTASILADFFATSRAYLFLTPEEKDLVAARCNGPLPPCEVIGAGLTLAPSPQPASGFPEQGAALNQGASADVRDRTLDRPAALARRSVTPDQYATLDPHGAAEGLTARRPFALYLGRIEKNKGCDRLIDYFLSYVDSGQPAIELVMAGPSIMEIPRHPAIRVLGLVDDRTRDALLAAARVLVIPSPYESLSMVLLEAWRAGTPALVYGRCKPLRGQTLRANGGLVYEQREEFVEALAWFVTRLDQARQFGRQGRGYVEREYQWPVVMAKIAHILSV